MVSDERSTLEPGALLGGTPYRIVRMLGAGAMGEVYEVEHAHLETRRALKILAADRDDRAELAARMRAEAKMLARVRHRNLVEVLDLGTTERGEVFFAMELLEGKTLRAVLADGGAIATRTALRIASEILEGLEAAHAAGLVHRDIKPDNLFVCAHGTVKVLDFGIAKLLRPGPGLTRTGYTMGTPRYMAPEQISGQAVDARADLYAVGLVLYEMLSGSVPFAETDPLALAYAHVHRAPAPLEGVPARVAAVVMEALAKAPAARPASARVLADALRACAEDETLAEEDIRRRAEPAHRPRANPDREARGAATRTSTVLFREVNPSSSTSYRSERKIVLATAAIAALVAGGLVALAALKYRAGTLATPAPFIVPDAAIAPLAPQASIPAYAAPPREAAPSAAPSASAIAPARASAPAARATPGTPAAPAPQRTSPPPLPRASASSAATAREPWDHL